ncbi:MraY family glycosyltransferase [Pedobacter sp. PWIIR3]
MSILLPIVISSVMLNAMLMSVIIRFSAYFKLFDSADKYRKNHEFYISRLGGVGIFLTLNIITFLALDHATFIYGILKAGAILFLLGLKDDLLGGAKPSEKFLMQLLAVGLLIAQGQCQAVELFPLVYGVQLSQFLNVLVIIILMLFIINAFNLIDGIDGLAAVLGLIVILYLSLQLLRFGYSEYAVVGLITSGSLIGFLKYNLISRKIFMGDVGAMLVGLISVILGIKFIQICDEGPDTFYNAPYALLMSLLIVPFFDSSRILLIRCFHGKSLLKGDRNHIHHRLQDIGLRDSQIVCVLATHTICMTCFVLCFQSLGNFSLICMTIFCSLIGNSYLTYRRGKFLFNHYSFVDLFFRDTLNLRRNIFRRDS